MKWHTLKRLNKAVRRTLALSLAMIMLSGNGYAANADEKALREQYGDDWKKVAALQPGDSYISGDTMYICHEQVYVDWKRVYSKKDLEWSGGEDRLLLMTDTSGRYLFLGNDYAQSYAEIAGVPNQVYLSASGATDTRQVIGGVIKDTSDNNDTGYLKERAYPELYEFYLEFYPTFYANGMVGYAYPDTFRTKGTMNAPYIRYVGVDSDNDNNRKFKIILPKDDGSISNVALGSTVLVNFESVTDWASKRLQLKSVSEGVAFTFYPKDGKVKIFQNVDGNEDLVLCCSLFELYGKDYDNPLEKEVADMVVYIGEKTVEKRIEVISLTLEDAEQNPEALENVYGGAIEFYHWEKITSSSQLPTGSDTYRALLVWDDKYFLQGDDFRLTSTYSSFSGMALYVNEERTDSAAPSNVAETPEIDLSKNEFYTMGGLGTPYIKFTHKDTDSDNDYCPYYTFQLAGVDDRPSSKWLCDGDNVLQVCLGRKGAGHYGGMDVGIIVGKEGDDDNDAEPGKVKLFFNEDGGFDTRFVYSGNVLYGDDSGWDGSGQFTLYIGKPVVYPAVRQNYVVGEDQFMHISQNGAMLKNVIIMVKKGGVLSVESWFMNNGRIIVDGGTLIVQNASNPLGDEMADDTEDSVMMPFADIHPTVSGSLELRNGGELIILDNARAAFSSIKATTGSSILNRGILLAETIDLHSSTLDNQKNAAVLAGYDFRSMDSFRIDDLVVEARGARMPKMASRLQEDVGCFTRRMYSSVHNDGWITYSTVRMSVRDDSVKQSGSGVYYKLRGDMATYMLTQ